MELQTLTNCSLADFAEIENQDANGTGEFYVEEEIVSGVTGLPKGQSAGHLVQRVYKEAGTGDIMYVYQEFRGLRYYGDKELAYYERFVFPKEVANGFNSYGIFWRSRLPNSLRRNF